MFRHSWIICYILIHCILCAKSKTSYHESEELADGPFFSSNDSHQYFKTIVRTPSNGGNIEENFTSGDELKIVNSDSTSTKENFSNFENNSKTTAMFYLQPEVTIKPEVTKHDANLKEETVPIIPLVFPTSKTLQNGDHGQPETTNNGSNHENAKNGSEVIGKELDFKNGSEFDEVMEDSVLVAKTETTPLMVDNSTTTSFYDVTSANYNATNGTTNQAAKINDDTTTQETTTNQASQEGTTAPVGNNINVFGGDSNLNISKELENILKETPEKSEVSSSGRKKFVSLEKDTRKAVVSIEMDLFDQKIDVTEAEEGLIGKAIADCLVNYLSNWTHPMFLEETNELVSSSDIHFLDQPAERNGNKRVLTFYVTNPQRIAELDIFPSVMIVKSLQICPQLFSKVQGNVTSIHEGPRHEIVDVTQTEGPLDLRAASACSFFGRFDPLVAILIATTCVSLIAIFSGIVCWTKCRKREIPAEDGYNIEQKTISYIKDESSRV